MGKRKITTIRIDQEILAKAHDLGLNVSKIAENALKDAINRMEGSNSQEGLKTSPESAQTIGKSSPGEIRTLVGGSKALYA